MSSLLMPRRARVVAILACLSLSTGALAARAPADGPRIAPVVEMAPQDLVGGAAQSVDVVIRNGNDSYGASGSKQLQAGDSFRIDFGSSCVTQVSSASGLQDTMSGTFSVVTVLPSAGSVLEIRFNGPAESMTLDDSVRVRAQVVVAPMAGDCALPTGDASHPRAASCAARVDAVSTASTFRPTSVAVSSARACLTDLQGPAGATGATGSVGAAGATGATGFPGVSGPTGGVGAQGPTGNVGPTGSAGPAGATGPTGAPGVLGVAGVTGPAGTAGTSGATGATGPTGAQGPQGTTGAVGAAGPMGIPGDEGPVGMAGPQGNTGVTGPAGIPGAAGAEGPTGALGPTGPTGLTGPSGGVGPQGPGGVVGQAGPLGARGPTGAGGATGSPGFSGAAGAAGATGPSGATGAAPPVLHAQHTVWQHGNGLPGSATAIAMNRLGRPLFAFDQGSTLRFNTCFNTNCNGTDGGGGSTSTDPLGAQASVAMAPDGLGMLAYRTTSGLRLGFCTSEACLFLGTTRNLAGDSIGQSALMTGSDGFPFAAYVRASTGELAYVHCTDATCSGKADIQVGAHAEGLAMTMSLGGFPVVSFADTDTGSARLFRCNGAACLTWAFTTIPSANVHGDTDVILNRDGRYFVAWQENSDLHVARCLDDTCSTSNRRVVASGQGEEAIAMATGADGLPVIVYSDPVAAELRAIRCLDEDCSQRTDSLVAPEFADDLDALVGTDGNLLIVATTNGSTKTFHPPNPFGLAWNQAR